MMEKNIIGVKNGLKMTNHGVILSTVEYGVIIQKSIINIEDEVKDHAKNNESKLQRNQELVNLLK